MGDVSELKTLIVVGSFITIFALLLGLATQAGFAGIAGTNKQLNIPAYFDLNSIFLGKNQSMYAKTWLGNVDAGILQNGLYRQEVNDGSGTFGGWEIRIASTKILSWYLGIFRQNFWWIIATDISLMNWRNLKTGIDYGAYLDRNEINYIYSTTGALDFTVYLSDQSLTFNVHLAYNTTEYASPSSAWDGNDLSVLCGMGLSQVANSYDVLELVKRVLFFQLDGVDPILKMIISVPLWIAIIYVSFILILRVTGAVFGGGGA